MSIERRTVLKGAAAATGGALLAGPFQGLVAAPAVGLGAPAFRGLRAIPDERDGKVRLHLPEGFAYRSFHDTESTVTLDDGTVLPGRHDGMAAFAGAAGRVTLVRNHEVNNPGPAFGPIGEHTYDPMARGGCTVVDTTLMGEVQESWTGINGTMMNCSGGPMPWGTWVTCEETVNGPDVGADFTGASNVPLTRPHGYIFEVPTVGRASGEPITRAGRFAHESVAFDPRGGALYLSEDNFGFASGFYRYTPRTSPMDTGRLDNEGRLQMLKVKGVDNAHLEATQAKGTRYHVEWVEIDDPDPTFPYTPGQPAPTRNDDAIRHVGDQGRAQGAALFSRLEGTVFDNGVVYFTSTQGGGPAMTTQADEPAPAGYGNGFGQVWGYDTRSETLFLVYQSPGKETFDFPDNITTSARGTLVVCEDSSGDNFIRGLSRGGQLWDIALNRLRRASDDAPRFGEEFAGSTFSPDGHTLFVNIQASAGLSFAIWGPWERIGV
ncbi:MAG TPA: alkaline phosphatase PhoX [Ornithinibacter sp.]|nr:alkaline phosphatase PhoX [Ornithinibacter sp.]